MKRYKVWSGLLGLVVAGTSILCLRATVAEEPGAAGSASASRKAGLVAAGRETNITSAGLTNKNTSARVARNVKEIESCVTRLSDAEANNKLMEMSETFNQINECCDELQGKNGRPAPPAEEWGIRDAAKHRQILDALGTLENDAEGMRSITRENSLGARRLDMIKKGWQQFMKHHADLAELLTQLPELRPMTSVPGHLSERAS